MSLLLLLKSPSTTPVGTTRATTWDVLTPAATTRAATWDALTAAATTRAATWDVLTPASTTRATTWNVAVTSVGYSAEVATDSPLAYWRLGDASGTTFADSSGNSRGATSSVAPTWGQSTAGIGIDGTSAQFSGSSTKTGHVAYTAWPSQSLVTVEGWFKTSSTTLMMICNRDNELSGAGRCWQFRMNAGKVNFIVFNTSVALVSITSPLTYNDSAWHHAVGTWDGTTARLYVDRSQVITGALAGTLNGGGTMGIGVGGASTTSTTTPFNGYLDEIAVYDAALSSTRIFAHYDAGTTAGTAAVATTRDTTWAVAASVSATRSTTWDVLTPASTSRSTTWATKATVVATRSTTWVTKAAVASTRSTTWNTRSPVSTTRLTTWAVLTLISLTRTTNWVTKAAASTSRSTTWGVRASVVTTRSTTWDMTASAVSIRATTWDVLSSRTITRTTTWAVLSLAYPTILHPRLTLNVPDSNLEILDRDSRITLNVPDSQLDILDSDSRLTLNVPDSNLEIT